MLTTSSNRVYPVIVTKYYTSGNNTRCNSKYISGHVLSDYRYNSLTNTFIKIPKVKLNPIQLKTLDILQVICYY